MEPDEWRPLERLQELVWRLVDEGFVDEADEEKCLVAVVSQFERWGQVPCGSVRHINSNSRVPREKQIQIVKEYIKFARHVSSARDRHAKIVALGVTPRLMTKWARKYFGRGTLASARPRSSLERVLEELDGRPWQTRSELYGATGVLRSTLSGALDWGMRTQRLKRRKGKQGLYEYARV